MPALICSTAYVLGCWNMWFQPTSPKVWSSSQSWKFAWNLPAFSSLTCAVYAA